MKKYLDKNLSSDERAEDLLSQMTLEEKVAQINMARGVEYSTIPSSIHNCSVDRESDFKWDKVEASFSDRGIGFIHDSYSIPKVFNKLQKYMIEKTRLGIPCIFTGEALHGVCYPGASVFPVPLCLGATFNPEIVNKIGSAISSETRSLGMHEILAPNLDLAREPRWGRVEETFGEDTYLSSRMAEAIVTGEQKGDISRDDAVVCEPKHYCVHGIAEGGINCATARVGKREVESCYLPVFEAAIKAGAYNVMAAYNSIDGDTIMCSKHYLTDVLKNRLKLRGYSRSDWGGIGRIRHAHHLTNSDKEAISLAVNAGLDMQGCDYTNEFWQKTLVELVNEGKVPIERINDAVYRVLRVKFELGLFENPYTDEKKYQSVIRCDEHKAVSLEAARQGLTLIKNNGVLPLDGTIKSIALIGPSSAAQKTGGYSPLVFGYTVNSIYDELKAELGDRVKIRQCNGCAITESNGETRVVDGQPHLTTTLDEHIEDTIDEALEIASECDAIVLVCGDNTVTSGEGVDRCDLRMHGRQRELVEKASKLQKPTVLVLENGKPIDISVENECMDAIIVAWFGGELGAKAIVEALVGKLNPAGRLPISFPSENGRIPCYYSMLPGGSVDRYLEGQVAPLYAFGHGLSYTMFKYSDMSIKKLGKYDYTVSVKVKNDGKMAGDEVVQLYINDIESSVVTPLKLLKGVKRITLKKDEEKTVEFSLIYDSFKLYNLDYEWVVEDGAFEIMIGASSKDIRLSQTIMIGCENNTSVSEPNAPSVFPPICPPDAD